MRKFDHLATDIYLVVLEKLLLINSEACLKQKQRGCTNRENCCLGRDKLCPYAEHCPNNQTTE